MTTQTPYESSLTDAQWELLSEFLPEPKSGEGKRGRPALNLRLVIDAILYLIKTGCQWRMLPHEFGNWNSIYYYFKKFRENGLWHEIEAALVKMERERQGRHPEPSAACADSQCVKTATQGIDVGFNGGKMIDGRAYHILVDTLGLILAVFVTAANFSERKGLQHLLLDYFSDGVKRLRHIWVDGGYSGSPLQQWAAKLKKTWKVVIEVVEKQGKGFNLVKRRWVAERTFAWLNNFRRHSKDYEVLTCNSEAIVMIAMIAILLRRLA